MTKICLCMIVKNEEKVILRSLQSVLPIISNFVIFDTGSSDGTLDILKNFARTSGITGYIGESEWVDFEHNRNESLAKAEELFHPDYMLVIDADDELHIGDPGEFENLTLDGYELDNHYGELVYPRVSLVSAKRDWQYKGVLHECLNMLDGVAVTAKIQKSYYLIHPEGARSMDKIKFKKDADTLSKALVLDPTNARYQFYLAQSLRDAGQTSQAITAYQKRARMGGWDEEVWYSMYQIAKLMEYTKSQPESIIDAYTRALEFRPSRPETYGCLARYLRSRKYYNMACIVAERGLHLGTCLDKLFLEKSLNTWVCLDEFSISAYWSGRYAEALKATEKLLADPNLPESEKPRVLKNLGFCSEKYGDLKLPM